jgi:hypothetical protein
MYSHFFGDISDAFKRREAARSAGNEAFDEVLYCNEYWALGNLVENMNNILISFLEGRNLNAFAPRLRRLIGALEQTYALRLSDPLTGAFNRATWRVYQLFRDFARGDVTRGDLQEAVRCAYLALNDFLSNSETNQKQFLHAVGSLNATARTAGDIHSQTSYTQPYQGSPSKGGAQAALSLLGLGTIEHFLSFSVSLYN